MVLRCCGSSWIMSYCGDTKLKRLDQGWEDFAVHNRLQVGDACVFELVSGYAGDGGKREVVACRSPRISPPKETPPTSPSWTSHP